MQRNARGSELRSRGISLRFAALSGLSLLSILAMSSLFFLTAQDLRQRVAAATARDIPRLIVLQETIKGVLDVQTSLSQLVNRANTGGFPPLVLASMAEEVKADLGAFLGSTENLDVPDYFRADFERFGTAVEGALALLGSAESENAAIASDSAWESARLVRSRLEVELAGSVAAFRAFEADADALSARNGRLQVGIAALFAALSVFSSWLLARLILKPLAISIAAIHRLGEGDFSTAVPTTKARDEMAGLLRDIALLRANLHEGFGKVAQASHHTASVARELSDDTARTVAFLDEVKVVNEGIRSLMAELDGRVGALDKASTDLANSVGRVDGSVATQVSAVDAVRAALTSTRASIERTAAIFRDEDRVVSSLRARTAEGEERLSESRADIARLSTSTSSVLELVTTIQDISERTNLLAMNAAIEAAHAGHAGRGFAVVSDEIRKLAENARESSERISGTVSAMIQTIERAEENQGSLAELLGFYVGETASLGSRLDEKRGLVERLGADSASVEQASGRLENSLGELKSTSDEARAALLSMRSEVDSTVATSARAVVGTETVGRTVSELAELAQKIAAVGESGRRTVETLEAAMHSLSTEGSAEGGADEEFMPWSDAEYSVLVPAMDAEHRRLVAVLNRLHHEMTTGASAEAIGGVLGELDEYVSTHFAHEEALLEAEGYPGLGDQRSAHGHFIERLGELKATRASGGLSVPLETLRLLKAWLVHHIQKADRVYGEWLSARSGAST